ncbi:MAG: TrbI/VirB10 family protein [Chthoniobacterales bacterium]|nr:TrbI/VirB10 family protein [Chthoniobacterales bacterium]
MNLRKLWTEFFQKPTGRLILFLLAAAVILAFILSGRGHRSQEPLNVAVPAQATAAKGYTFTEDIPPTAPARSQAQPPMPVERTAARPAPTPKAPPPIPQTIFATKEESRSELYLPFGRLLRCELVNTVESTNIATPIIGLITEDVWHDGRLVLPAGTEVHGIAQKSAARERIGSERQWVLVFQDGRELPLSGTVLDYAPDGTSGDQWGETDGSAGLRGYMIASDKYAEAKAILASMISAGAGAFPETTNLISPLTGGATVIQNGGWTDAISAGIQAGGQIYAQRLLEGLQKDPYYVRVSAGTLFYLYVTQTVDIAKATTGLSAANSTQPKP